MIILGKDTEIPTFAVTLNDVKNLGVIGVGPDVHILDNRLFTESI